MDLHFFNTLTHRIEAFVPSSKTVGFYCCGPTVYDFAHIGNFGVTKSKRHQGIGKMLMDSFMEICRSKEIDEVRLGVFNKNVGSHKFYEQYGFKPFEQRMQIMLK